MFENISKEEIEKNPKNPWPFSDMTPFHIACEKGHFRIAEFIMKRSIEYNIDLNSTSIYGLKGFHFACLSGHVTIVELLIKNSVEYSILI